MNKESCLLQTFYFFHLKIVFKWNDSVYKLWIVCCVVLFLIYYCLANNKLVILRQAHLKNVLICEIQNFDTHYYNVPLGHSVNLFAIPLLLCVSVPDLCLCLGHLLSSPVLLGLKSSCAFINFFIITTANGLPSYSWNGILRLGPFYQLMDFLVYITLLVYFLNIICSHIFFTLL